MVQQEVPELRGTEYDVGTYFHKIFNIRIFYSSWRNRRYSVWSDLQRSRTGWRQIYNLFNSRRKAPNRDSVSRCLGFHPLVNPVDINTYIYINKINSIDSRAAGLMVRRWLPVLFRVTCQRLGVRVSRRSV
jgi:hypothetical protein